MTGFDHATFLSILTIYFVVIAVPGPNTLVVLRYSLNGQGRAAFIAAIGIAVGATINAAITMFGAATLTATYPLTMVFVALVGGGVLIWLGLECLFSALSILGVRRPIRQAAPEPVNDLAVVSGEGTTEPDIEAQEARFDVAFWKGLWVNLSNPKGIAFFLVLYAPLISGASLPFKFTVLGTCFLLELIWFGFLILLSMLPFVRRVFYAHSAVFDLVMAGVMFFLGGGILLDLPEYLSQAGV